DEGFLVGYSLQSKAFRVYNLETKRVEENLHITFLENKPNVTGKGPTWLFDLDYLTDSMDYQLMRSENQANKHPDLKTNEKTLDKEDKVFLDELERLKRQEQDANDAAEALRKEFAQETEELLLQAETAKASSTNIVNTASTPVSTASPYDGLSFTDLTNPDPDDSEIPALEDIYNNPTDGIFTNSSYDDGGAVADFTNLEPVVNVSPIPTLRINSIHPSTLILGDPQSAVQTRSKVTKSSGAHAFVSYIKRHRRNNHKDFQHCLFACFLSQNKPKKISKALEDENLPYGKKAIGTKWVYRNKKDERGVMVRNKARLVAQGHRQEEGIDYDEDKYVAEILKKFDFVSVKTASTPIETQKPLVKDEEASDVDVHLYRSMIGSLMYLTASRPDIMFAVCACSRFQVNPKTSHLSAVKRIFRYLKGKPKLGLWYPRVSSFDLEAYSDSDYAGANLDRKSTTGGCQFLGRRLISWQCKKQTIVATSTIEAEYVAAANCCGQNPVYHSKTKHIAIRHHFIRDAYEKKLIQVLKIHTDDNVADLLTKAFDVSRFQFLSVVTIVCRSIFTISGEFQEVYWVFKESLGRNKDGIEALLLPNLFILALKIVSTDSAKLIPLGKDSTAIETLKKIPPRV
ncbi:putative ribonuclease H-like domain-containing protein, partial [Tanacetum coccineum]